MKRFLAMVLAVVMCIAMTTVCAQAAKSNQFVGYWEVQNVAVGGYTVGASYLGFDLHASVHDDGVCILIMDDQMNAGYISGYAGNYYLEDGTDFIPLSYDSQGRMHIDLSSGGTKVDVRMRKAYPEPLSSRLTTYVGKWTVKSANVGGITLDGETLSGLSVTFYDDGFGVLVMDDAMMAIRLAMFGGNPCIVDGTGDVMVLKMDANGVMSFTMNGSDTSMTFYMQRSLY